MQYAILTYYTSYIVVILSKFYLFSSILAPQDQFMFALGTARPDVDHPLQNDFDETRTPDARAESKVGSKSRSK